MPNDDSSRYQSAWLRITRKALYYGADRFCSVCKSSVRFFKPYGLIKRAEAQCPVCNTVERHRLTWLFFEQRTNLFDAKPKRMLHVAPEPQLEQQLRRIPNIEYVSTDVRDGKAEMSMDITDLSFADSSFDVILCSHVLEHVLDDRKAMRELSRVLSPSGWAALLVPITATTTFEDPSVTDPQERERLFGKTDHVRAYGPDFKERLLESGFSVEVINAAGLLADHAQAQRMQLKDEELYFCRKA